MKRFFSVIFSALLVISLLGIDGNATSDYNNLCIEKTVTYSSSKNASREELFVQKLEEIGISQDYYDILSQKMFDDICDAQTISLKSSYYIESTDRTSMIQTTKESYNKVVKLEKEKIENKKTEIEKAMQTRSGDEISSSEGISEIVDRGTLNIGILLVSSDNINYECAALFRWETMPSSRHTDAFGLARDDNTVVEQQSASGLYTVTSEVSGLSGGEYKTSIYHDTTELEFSDLKVSPDGYAFEIKLNKDVASSTSPYTTILYTEMTGMIMYSGFVKSTSIIGVNHWAVYAHQKINLLINGVNFSYPFAAGFDITLKKTYEQITDEHTWRRL